MDPSTAPAYQDISLLLPVPPRSKDESELEVFWLAESVSMNVKVGWLFPDEVSYPYDWLEEKRQQTQEVLELSTTPLEPIVTSVGNGWVTTATEPGQARSYVMIVVPLNSVTAVVMATLPGHASISQLERFLQCWQWPLSEPAPLLRTPYLDFDLWPGANYRERYEFTLSTPGLTGVIEGWHDAPHLVPAPADLLGVAALDLIPVDLRERRLALRPIDASMVMPRDAGITFAGCITSTLSNGKVVQLLGSLSPRDAGEAYWWEYLAKLATFPR